MKQWGMIALAAVMLLTATACGQKPDPESSAPVGSTTTASTTTTTGDTTDTTSSESTGTTGSTDAPSSTTGKEPSGSQAPTKTSTTTAKPSTTKPSTTSGKKEPAEDATMTKYDQEKFLTPYWKGKTVYHEAISFVENAAGEVVSGELMYTPTEIICVRSADLKTVYKEGVDYRVEGKRLVLLKGSDIAVMPYDEYLPKYLLGEASDWLASKSDPTRHVGLSGDIAVKYQVAVSYTHSDRWMAYTPENQLSYLPRTKAALNNKQPLNIVFYGDSITAGFEASGCFEKVIDQNTLKEYTLGSQPGRAPYTPAWAEMVCAGLRTKYGYNDITKINRGAGGSYSPWGVKNADLLINPHDPDLVVIGFGMNQVGYRGEDFFTDILNIIRAVRAKHPEAEFLLVSCMEPNTEAASFANHKLAEQEQALCDLRSSYEGVGVAKVHQMCTIMMSKGKVYTDITGNNLNHPNDFTVRLYAQTVLAALGY